MHNDNAPRLILASNSQARKAMLAAAGVTFEAIAAAVDEDAITAEMTNESDCVEASDIALALAAAKAIAVSNNHPGAYVVGSDQVLALGRRFLAKAVTVKQAGETLSALRGRRHELVSAVALARNGDVLWHTIESAEMHMRNFSNAFLDAYLSDCGESILGSVGCYHFEGRGAQLFERVEGDHFTIQGMPLLPLLAKLREESVLPT